MTTIYRSNMRLFNGHLKLDDESVKKIFLKQLNNIYCIKNYLVANLPVMASNASFQDLKNAILESVSDIKVQLLRLDEIYKIINEIYDPQKCIGIRVLNMEAYAESKAPDMTALETDLSMLIHLRIMESIELTSFAALYDLARSMPQDSLTLLLKQNLDMARDSKELYELITKEYIS